MKIPIFKKIFFFFFFLKIGFLFKIGEKMAPKFHWEWGGFSAPENTKKDPSGSLKSDFKRVGFFLQSCQKSEDFFSLNFIQNIPGRAAQSVACLTTDACLTADPGVSS